MTVKRSDGFQRRVVQEVLNRDADFLGADNEGAIIVVDEMSGAAVFVVPGCTC
jgi:hypothetical protein